jgi:hypothetical protein
MNIEELFKSSHSILVNGTPPCQNIMFPSQEHWQQQNPYQHQPLIHIPKKTSTTTLGEVGASVDMMRAQLTELSRRMCAVEFNLSEFKNSVSNDIFLLKSTLSEHATEMLNSRDIVEDTHAHVKKTNNLIEQQDVCIDRLADIVNRNRNRMKPVASNIDLGIIRRRLSRVEDFMNEFYQHFESFTSVKEIISGLSDHINECDRDISMMVTKRNPMFETNYDDGDDDNNDNNDNNDNDNNDNNDNDTNDNNDNGNNECDQNILLTFIKNDQEEDDDFEKL